MWIVHKNSTILDIQANGWTINYKLLYSYLVGGLEHQFYFPINIGCLIIPTDFHIFQRGGPTTNQLLWLDHSNIFLFSLHYILRRWTWSVPSKANLLEVSYGEDVFFKGRPERTGTCLWEMMTALYLEVNSKLCSAVVLLTRAFLCVTGLKYLQLDLSTGSNSMTQYRYRLVNWPNIVEEITVLFTHEIN